MTTVQPSLFARDDTFFGVCEGLGEDFGIDPLFLRLAFTAGLFFYPLEAIIGYVATGAVVLATRLIFPVPRPVAVQAVEANRARIETVAARDSVEREPLPLAA